jgi:hypothetical protein
MKVTIKITLLSGRDEKIFWPHFQSEFIQIPEEERLSWLEQIADFWISGILMPC